MVSFCIFPVRMLCEHLVHALHILYALFFKFAETFEHNFGSTYRIVHSTVVLERNVQMCRYRIQLMVFKLRQGKAA